MVLLYLPGSYTGGKGTNCGGAKIIGEMKNRNAECVSPHARILFEAHPNKVSMYVPPSTPASPSTTVNSNALSDAHQVRL
jgi:hypothetical protein